MANCCKSETKNLATTGYSVFTTGTFFLFVCVERSGKGSKSELNVGPAPSNRASPAPQHGNQCCGSGMVFSQIRIQFFFQSVSRIRMRTFFILYPTEKEGWKLKTCYRVPVPFSCFFQEEVTHSVSWIRIRIKLIPDPDSGSRGKKHRISDPDLDPQHWFSI
jgi:hypothetical protein